MPPNFGKAFIGGIARNRAKVPAKNLSSADNIVSTRLKTPEEMQETYREMMASRPTHSLLDLPINLGKKILPEGTKRKFDDAVYSYQSKLMDWDSAAGENLASKNKLFKVMFNTTDHIPGIRVETESGKVFDASIPRESARLSAFNDKLKGFAVPMLALFGLSSIIDKEDKIPKEPGRGDTDLERVSSTDNTREMLISKIAETLACMGDTAPKQGAVDKGKIFVDKAKRASELLKQASHKIEDLEDQVVKLAEENNSLKLQVIAKTRSSLAVKLAQEMCTKGMIKKADVDSQIEYIMGLNDENYTILKNTVSSVPFPKKATPREPGVDKLSYIVLESDNSNPEKPSFADAIINLGNS